MAEITNPLDAAIAHLEQEKAEIETLIQGLKRRRDGGATSVAAAGAVTGVAVDLATIPSDAFFKLTIGDAAVKFLTIWASRKPQPTNTIIEALERGGLEKKAYPTVYGILNRRANKEGDVVNVKGDWGLAEWYGGGTSKPTRRSRPQQRVSLDPATFKDDQPDTPEAKQETPAREVA